MIKAVPLMTIGVAFSATIASSPAVACSDLANICAQQAAHHREMNDIAATPPWGGSSDNGSFQPQPRNFSKEELEAMMAETRRKQAIEEAEHQRRLKEDPDYRDFYEGHWLPPVADALEKGGPCVLHFSRKGQGVMISGPFGDFKGAFLTFYGYHIPSSKKVRTISMTLRQDNDPPQTVRVFNGTDPWFKKLGMVYFAVPNIEAALSGMTNDMVFYLQHKNNDVMSIKWHSGDLQRKAMKSCLARQQKLAAK
jgi:hypothetical protein